MKHNLFTERTKLPNFILILFWLSFLLFLGYSWKKNDYSLPIFAVIVVTGLFLHFLTFKLKISNSSIEYSMAPFIHKKINRSAVKSYEFIKISALGDFGGWGIRYSGKYGWGYIMGDNDAVIFKYDNGKRVTFSVNDRNAMELFLSENNWENKSAANIK